MNTENYFNVHTSDDNHQVKTIKVGGVKSTMCLNRFELLCEPGQEIREELILQMLQEWVEMREREM